MDYDYPDYPMIIKKDLKILEVSKMKRSKCDKHCSSFYCASVCVLHTDYNVFILQHDVGEFNTAFDFIKKCFDKNIFPEAIYLFNISDDETYSYQKILDANGYVMTRDSFWRKLSSKRIS